MQDDSTQTDTWSEATPGDEQPRTTYRLMHKWIEGDAPEEIIVQLLDRAA